MKNIIFTSLLLIGLIFNSLSQDENKNNSIESQFNELIDNSNTYQSFKVIDKSKLNVLQKNIHDSIALYEKTISQSKIEIINQKNKIDNSEQKIGELQIALEKSKNSVDNIDFLGMPTQKAYYTLIMWTIITVLLLLCIIMFMVFKKGQRNTKNAKEKLEETKQELDSLRKRSLEREQKIRRELQNELNKNNLRRE